MRHYIIPNSLSFPYKVPKKSHVISKSNEDILAFRDLGTLFSGAHVCAKNIRSMKIYICACTAFMGP